MEVAFTCSGHPNIRATHAKTLELTRDPDVTQRGTCIVGTASTHDPADLRRLRGRVTVDLAVGDHVQRFEALLSPFFLDDDSLVFRRGPILRQRTFAGEATAAAADLDRDLVHLLGAPGAELRVTLTSDDRPGPGVLWVLATPIGNDADLSPRARSVLAAADLVLAEDTRRFRLLAATAGLPAPRVESYHLANEAAATAGHLEALLAGARLALVSDAGTPLCSDPGYLLVRAAVEAGLAVVPVPGPSAMLTALVASGLPATRVLFEGYLPRTRTQRRRHLADLAPLDATLVLLESPNRILEMLDDVALELPHRTVSVGREMTKVHEEFLTGPPTDVRDRLAAAGKVLGETTVVVGPPDGAGTAPAGAADIEALVRSLLADAVPTPAIVRAVEAATPLSRNEAYRLVLALRDGAKDEGPADDGP